MMCVKGLTSLSLCKGEKAFGCLKAVASGKATLLHVTVTVVKTFYISGVTCRLGVLALLLLSQRTDA